MKRKAQAVSETSGDEVAEDTDEQTSETSSGSGSETSEVDDSSSNSGSDGKGEVDVDFEFFDPQEIDFHGLKALLQTYLDGSTYSCSELVDTVITQVHYSAKYCTHTVNIWCRFVLFLQKIYFQLVQKTVGTVVKTTDSIDPIAVLTVLPLRRYASLTCLKEIKSYLEANCDSKCQQAFQQVQLAIIFIQQLRYAA